MENKKITLEIEQLEERIAPIVHPFTPIVAVGAVAASGGAAGGVAAFPHVFSTGQISGAPVPLFTPGVGP